METYENQPWELTPDIHRHNGVFYRCWRRKDAHCEWVYNLTCDAITPPSPFSGGYKSFESAVWVKFGTKI